MRSVGSLWSLGSLESMVRSANQLPEVHICSYTAGAFRSFGQTPFIVIRIGPRSIGRYLVAGAGGVAAVVAVSGRVIGDRDPAVGGELVRGIVNRCSAVAGRVDFSP